MKIYHMDQNNSGGKFHTDDVLCHDMYIEADSAEEANKMFLDWGGYFDGVSAGFDCGCCGDRWSELGEHDKMEAPFKLYSLDNLLNDTETPEFDNLEDYLEAAANERWSKMHHKIYRIFYKNGTVKEFKPEAA